MNHTSAFGEYEEMVERNPRKSSKILLKSWVDKVLSMVSPNKNDTREQTITPNKLKEVYRGPHNTQKKLLHYSVNTSIDVSVS